MGQDQSSRPSGDNRGARNDVKQRAAFRGQPLILLAAIILGWLSLRVALWDAPFDKPGTAIPRAFVVVEGTNTPPLLAIPAVSEVKDHAQVVSPIPLRRESWPHMTVDLPPYSQPQPLPLPLLEPSTSVPPNLSPSIPIVPPASVPVSAPVEPAAAKAPPPMSSPERRWSADAWLLLRRDSAGDALGPILSDRASYGRSQAGVVLRYALPDPGALRPQVYVRSARALAGSAEQEIGVGLSIHPIATIPVTVATELRANEGDFGTDLRPAAYIVSAFPPVDLPLGLRGEAYTQGGYVGGSSSTAFVDGQAKVERNLPHVGAAELSIGAGVWGGAQNGADRLDVGPTAAAAFRLGNGQARIAADYRFRVAGDAEPGSGPALTLSAGF